MSMEEDVGYIKATVKNTHEDVNELKGIMNKHMRDDVEAFTSQAQRTHELEKRLDKVKWTVSGMILLGSVLASAIVYASKLGLIP